MRNPCNALLTTVGLVTLAVFAGTASAGSTTWRDYRGVTDERHVVTLRAGQDQGLVRIQTAVTLRCGGGKRPVRLAIAIVETPVGRRGAFRVRLLANHPRYGRVNVTVGGAVAGAQIHGRIVARGERHTSCRGGATFAAARQVGAYDP